MATSVCAAATTGAGPSGLHDSLPSGGPSTSSSPRAARRACPPPAPPPPPPPTKPPREEPGGAPEPPEVLLSDDDFGSSDEVKIFKDECEDEEKEFASHEELQAALSEDKTSLIQETEFNIKQEAMRLHDHHSSSGKQSRRFSVMTCRAIMVHKEPT